MALTQNIDLPRPNHHLNRTEVVSCVTCILYLPPESSQLHGDYTEVMQGLCLIKAHHRCPVHSLYQEVSDRTQEREMREGRLPALAVTGSEVVNTARQECVCGSGCSKEARDWLLGSGAVSRQTWWFWWI